MSPRQQAISNANLKQYLDGIFASMMDKLHLIAFALLFLSTGITSITRFPGLSLDFTEKLVYVSNERYKCHKIAIIWKTISSSITAMADPWVKFLSTSDRTQSNYNPKDFCFFNPFELQWDSSVSICSCFCLSTTKRLIQSCVSFGCLTNGLTTGFVCPSDRSPIYLGVKFIAHSRQMASFIWFSDGASVFFRRGMLNSGDAPSARPW